MFEAWLWFVSWGWLFCMVGIGVYLVWRLARNWADATWVNRLCVLAMLVLVFHVWEEWVVPGGFHWVYNLQHGSSPAMSNYYPMNKLTDMITNFGGELLGLVWLLWKKDFRDEGGIAVGLFSIFEFVIHVYITVLSVSQYGGAPYSPGLITATVGFLPVGVALVLAVIRDKASAKAWAGGLLILVLLSVVFVNMPESLLKSTNNPYGWDDYGYYDQFVELEEVEDEG